jgi:NADH-quinone oxidoreductase subunit E
MSYEFSADTEKKFQWLLTRYPQKKAVLIPLLHHVQNEVGYLSSEAMEYVAKRMELSPARIKEVASFYSLFRFKPCGKFTLQVCQNLSCHLLGAENVIEKIKEKLSISEGDVSADGLFSLERVECLASCSTAPVMQVNNWDFHENLDVEKIEKVLEALKNGKWADASFEKRKEQGSLA